MAKPLKFNAGPIVPKIEPVTPTTGYQSVGIQKSEIPNKPLPAGQQYVLQSDGSYKSFAKPTGLSPAPQPEPVFDGGIKYKATGTKGVYTNAQGQYVNASGKLVDAPEPDTISGVVKQTYAEQAESQMRGQFKTDYENALKYGITLPYKTFEEYKDYIQGGKQDNLSYLQKQQDLARGVEDMQTQTALEGIEAAKKGVTSTMAQSREGAVTTSKPQFTQEFASQMQRQVDQIKLEKASAEAQRQQAVTELKRAQEAGDVELAQSIQGQLSAIDSNLRQIDTQALQASTLANQQALDLAKFESDKSIAEQAASRANLESFTSMVDLGTEMTTEGIMQFSKSLNVPFEAAYNYYAGSQKVRDDKNLSQEEKVLKNAQLKQELNDTITGQNIATVKQWSILEQMYKSGASAEEISRAKDAFGFKDENDPIYKLDLQIKQAEAKMKTAEANGEIISPIDKLDYAAKVAELMDKTGGTGAYKPTTSKYDVTATANGIVVGVADGAKLARGQCGEFVNDVLGIGVGDKLSDKTKFIDESIVVPSAGMAFVTSRGYDLGGGVNSGHIGIVESVNPDGTFNTVEANYNGDEKITRRTNVPITDVVGFIRPPNAEFIGSAGAGVYSEAQKKVMEKLDPNNVTGTTLKILEKAGLTSTDLLSYEPEKRPLTPEAKDDVEAVLSSIDELRKMDMSGAVGQSIQKFLRFGSAEDGFISASDAEDFRNAFNSFRDTLVLPNLGKLKGPMSDKDVQFLRNTATALNLGMSEEQFNKTLDALENKYREALNQDGDTPSVEDDFVENMDLNDILMDQFLNQL